MLWRAWFWVVACSVSLCLRIEGSCALRVLAVEEPETLGFAAVRWEFRSSDATAIPDANEAPWNAMYSAAPRLAAEKIIIAYTGSSDSCEDRLPALPHRSGNRRRRSAAKTRRRSRIRSVWQGRPKTSVAVRARAASRAHCISLRALAIATVRRKEHRARRRGIHLSTV